MFSFHLKWLIFCKHFSNLSKYINFLWELMISILSSFCSVLHQDSPPRGLLFFFFWQNVYTILRLTVTLSLQVLNIYSMPLLAGQKESLTCQTMGSKCITSLSWQTIGSGIEVTPVTTMVCEVTSRRCWLKKHGSAAVPQTMGSKGRCTPTWTGCAEKTWLDSARKKTNTSNRSPARHLKRGFRSSFLRL